MNKYQLMYEELENSSICVWVEDYDYEDNNISGYETSINEEEMKQLIKELVDKATPKKVKIRTYYVTNCISEEKTTHHIHLCPNCGHEVKLNYCPCCGSALDWRKEDEE